VAVRRGLGPRPRRHLETPQRRPKACDPNRPSARVDVDATSMSRPSPPFVVRKTRAPVTGFPSCVNTPDTVPTSTTRARMSTAVRSSPAFTTTDSASAGDVVDG
jgi:hypothetical protein